MLGTSARRLTAGIAGLAVALGLVGLVGPVASAAEDTVLGDLSVPATGDLDSFLMLTTPALCPVDPLEEAPGRVKAFVTGSGLSSPNIVPVTNIGATEPFESGFRVQASKKLKTVFEEAGITAPSGQYVINLRCQSSNGGKVYGGFLTTIAITAGASPFSGTYAVVPPTPNGVATTTALTATPASPVKAGTPTVLKATITPASAGTVAGAVQFKDGATNLGEPVVVTDNVATAPSQTLAAGSHSLTAVFISSNTNTFLGSTSTASTFVVAGVPTISGTPAVGKSIGCSTSVGGTQTVAWLVNGTASTVKTKTVTVPASWASKSVVCRVTWAPGVVQSSAAKKVALGAKLVAKVKPKIGGTAKVGKVLTCAKGTWAPAATSYKYQWLRGTTVIKGKTTSTYKLVAADKKKTVSCKVTAVKAGYVSGLAAAPGKKIS